MGAKMEEKEGKLYFPHFEDHVLGVNVDGDLRARAIQQLYKQQRTSLVLVTGGYETGIHWTVSRAQALIAHTAQEYDVPKDFMYALTSQPHTIGNIQTAATFLSHAPGVIPNGSVAFLTNAFHLRRTAHFVQKNKFFQKNDLDVSFLSAEGMLHAAGILSRDNIAAYYRSVTMAQRIQKEDQGIEDSKNNVYTQRTT